MGVIRVSCCVCCQRERPGIRRSRRPVYESVLSDGADQMRIVVTSVDRDRIRLRPRTATNEWHRRRGAVRNSVQLRLLALVDCASEELHRVASKRKKSTACRCALNSG